ncbi:MAG: peptidoglycan-binding protein [Clostridia bacterium]|nr:peptidoglycan-binding protein [Clostridia bacterium]
MILAEKIIETALAEIGVKESPANSNRQKYGKEYGVNGTAWCCQFVWWVFKHAGAAALFYGGKKTAYCPTLMQYYKSKGQIVKKNFEPGDIIFFDFNGNGQPDHVGIVERVSGNKVYTIEGNTSVGNDTNGGQVMRRTRSGKNILCAARPKYDKNEKEGCEVKLETLKKGCEGDNVKALQTLLIGYGYDCGKHGADGDFGADTDRAVRVFQKGAGLTVDGVVGKNTWTKLVGGM